MRKERMRFVKEKKEKKSAISSKTLEDNGDKCSLWGRRLRGTRRKESHVADKTNETVNHYTMERLEGRQDK